MSNLHKLSYKFNTVPFQILASNLVAMGQMHLKFTLELQRTKENQHNLEGES